MGVKFNHQEVIKEVFEQYNCGSCSWSALRVVCNRPNDVVSITDIDDDFTIHLHIDQAQKLKEILNEVLM